MKSTKPVTKPIGVRLTDEVREELDTLASKEGRSISSQIAFIVKQYLKTKHVTSE